MIGYYVHHVGHGHLHRAAAVARALEGPVTALSSLERPPDWPGPWIDLPRDDASPRPHDVDAGGALHWVPRHDAGLRSRMSEIARWIDDVDPDLMIVDVSVEVSMLARLHGVPVVSVVLPGDRADDPHRLSHRVATSLVAVWPPAASGMTDAHVEADQRFHAVGAVSRFDGRDDGRRHRGPDRRVAVLLGTGGTSMTQDGLDAARRSTPGWRWDVLHPDLGEWVDDPWPLLSAADVVVTHAGQNALAEVAAARVPAVVVPQERPHGEQRRTATVLARGSWPAIVSDRLPTRGWSSLLARADSLDGASWAGWNDGEGAARFAQVVRSSLDSVGR